MTVQIHRFSFDDANDNDDANAVQHWQSPFGTKIRVNSHSCHIKFNTDMRHLGNAPFTNEQHEIQHIQFIRLGHKHAFSMESLNEHVEAQKQRWGIESCTSFITAASMSSLRAGWQTEQNEWVAVYLTTGLANTLRAGDHASSRRFESTEAPIDTINMVIETSLPLSNSAAIESLCIAVEAKCTVMQELNIRSTISNEIATGTGTDALLIAHQHAARKRIPYAGKHTLLGELIGTTVKATLHDSLRFYE